METSLEPVFGLYVREEDPSVCVYEWLIPRKCSDDYTRKKSYLWLVYSISANRSPYILYLFIFLFL